jgi:hypothetical protein
LTADGDRDSAASIHLGGETVNANRSSRTREGLRKQELTTCTFAAILLLSQTGEEALDDVNIPLVSLSEVLAPEATITPCEYARERHRNMLMWRNLWTILLFAFGSAVIVFAVLAIALFIRQEWITGAIMALGTLAQGAAITWVVDRRAEAVREEEVAYQDVAAKCTDTTAADKLRASYNLIGGVR